MHKILTVKLFRNQCKKHHPILNHKDLRISMSTMYFSIAFAVTTSCPLNILKCTITHLYQTLTLLKKVTTTNCSEILTFNSNGDYWMLFWWNRLKPSLGIFNNSYKGYLICQSSPRLEPSFIYLDMGHQDFRYLQPIAVNSVGHIDATTSLMGDLNLDLSSECSLINHLTTWHNPLHWIYIRIVSIRYFQFRPH